MMEKVGETAAQKQKLNAGRGGGRRGALANCHLRNKLKGILKITAIILQITMTSSCGRKRGRKERRRERVKDTEREREIRASAVC